jgi:hypothetical protein
VTHTMTKRVVPQHETAAGMAYGYSKQWIAAAPALARTVIEEPGAVFRPKKAADAGRPAAGHRQARARGPPQIMSPGRLHRTQAITLVHSNKWGAAGVATPAARTPDLTCLGEDLWAPPWYLGDQPGGYPE